MQESRGLAPDPRAGRLFLHNDPYPGRLRSRREMVLEPPEPLAHLAQHHSEAEVDLNMMADHLRPQWVG